MDWNAVFKYSHQDHLWLTYHNLCKISCYSLQCNNPWPHFWSFALKMVSFIWLNTPFFFYTLQAYLSACHTAGGQGYTFNLYSYF